jgi:GTPase SAR1 family protein
MRNADGAVIVYDITSDASFKAVNYWLQSLRQVADEDICVYLIGNKYDLVKEVDINRRVSLETIQDYIKNENISYWTECSAKLNYNIKNTFDRFYKGNFKAYM